MSVRDYSLKFCTLVAKLQDWPETMKVDYYRNGLNPDIMIKVLERADPPTLVDWIRLAAEVESCQKLVKAIRQHQQPVAHSETRPKPCSRSKTNKDHVCEQWMKQGKCLICGRSGHFATKCPANRQPNFQATATLPSQKGGSRPSSRAKSVKNPTPQPA